jgi:hypothetical protein
MSASTSSRSFGLAAALAALSGCTLLMQGTSQTVHFSSEPEGAEFIVGGQSYTTPKDVELPKEDYQIFFRKAGYVEEPVALKRRVSWYFYGSLVMGLIAAAVDLSTGAYKEFETTKVHVVLTPLPDTAKELPVSITSDPPGAEILIGGATYGRTPKELKLAWLPADRERRITFRLDGYLEKTVPLAREEPKLHAVLARVPELRPVRFVSTPAGAEVRVDGLVLGAAPVSRNLSWESRDARKQVEFTLEGYRPLRRELTFAEAEVSATLDESVEEILLPVKVDPKGAKIAVDGVPVAEAPANVRLRWSVSRTKHTLTVTHPGYATKTVEVRREDAAKPVELRLSPALP